MSGGAGEMTGASWSSTVTAKEQDSPVESVVVTAVVPMWKNVPETGELVAVPQVPLVVAGELKVTTAPSWPGSLLTTMLAGHARVQAGVVGLEAFVVSSALLSTARRSCVSLLTTARRTPRTPP